MIFILYWTRQYTRPIWTRRLKITPNYSIQWNLTPRALSNTVHVSKRSPASKLLNSNIYKNENTYKIDNNIMIIGNERKKNVDVFSSILNTITGPLMLCYSTTVHYQWHLYHVWLSRAFRFFFCMFVNFIKISPWNALKCKQTPLEQNNYQPMLWTNSSVSSRNQNVHKRVQ